jgi:hypothetical protein
VAQQGEALRTRLEQLRDLREWDLKVSYDARSLGEHLGEISDEVARLERELANAAPGRRYLLERKRDTLVGEETSRAAKRLALELDQRLTSLAREARRLPLSSSKGDLSVVLNAAYLVVRSQEKRLAEAAEEAAGRLGRVGIDVQLSGPWAPYRFLAPDDARSTGEDLGRE